MGNVTNKFKLYQADQFKKSFDTNNIWLFVGKPTAWVSDTDPTALGQKGYTTDTLLAEIQNWDDLMSIQRVNNTSFVIPYKQISVGATFSQYTDNDDIFASSYGTFFGVSGRNVYKCISNNSNSTVSDPPVEKSSTVIKTSDGFVWKYMYSITTSEWDKFQTPSGDIGSWVPVKRLTQADSSGQWDLAMYNATDGEIQHITTKSGTTFSYSTTSPFYGKETHKVYINKDLSGAGYGSGFVGEIKRHTDGNYYIDITNAGSDYKKIVTVHSYNNTDTYTDLGTNLHPVISPTGGHGWDAVSELGGSNVMLNVDLNESMSDFITENDYRKVGLLINPLTEASKLDYVSVDDILVFGNKYSQSVNTRNLLKLQFASGDWSNLFDSQAPDKEIVQIKDGSDTDNKGIVVEVIPADYTMYVLVTHGKFDISKTGATYNSPQIRVAMDPTVTKTVGTYTQVKLKNYSGDIIYVDNIDAVLRSASTQKIKLVIEF